MDSNSTLSAFLAHPAFRDFGNDNLTIANFEWGSAGQTPNGEMVKCPAGYKIESKRLWDQIQQRELSNSCPSLLS